MKRALPHGIKSNRARSASDGERAAEVLDEAARLAPVVLPVALAGTAVSAIAASTLVASAPTLTTLAGLAVLLAAAVFAEIYPVPVEKVPADGVSLAAVFIVGTGLIYGWAPAVLVAACAQLVPGVVERRPLIRLVYNTATYAVAGALASAGASLAGQGSHGMILVAVLAGSAAFYGTNVTLVAAVVARFARLRFPAVLSEAVFATIVPFAIMASATLMLKVLWDRSPLFLFSLIGPLLAISLYQRSTHRALTLMRLALTDPLTGLGNHRHFHEQIEQDIDRARALGTPFTLCLIDLDDFKRINDRYGHPAGDRVLAEVASCLRHDGEAFRLGGDEFALLLPGRNQHEGLVIAESIVERIAAVGHDPGGRVSVSVGVATSPDHGVARDELVRNADGALYWAKEHGKNRVRVFTAEMVEIGKSFQPTTLESGKGAGWEESLRAAATLARAVDARDAYAGRHSHRVGVLASCVAARMGLDEEQVALLRIAGELHDLGKLAIPEDVLSKQNALSVFERQVLARHPEVGHRMLRELGAGVIAEWVLHHHERWDGEGYPDRLEGEAIPLGARILHVCDSFDAMTSKRSYRDGIPSGDAIHELVRCAGTQFDPRVVAALASAIGQPSVSLVRQEGLQAAVPVRIYLLGQAS